jgi:MFS superfamily sulfate permease-like transporter
MPVSSSASRSAVPAALGSRTQLVSIVGAASLAATILLFRPALAEVPRAALAAVIVTAAILIIDVAGFRALWAVSRTEAALALVTATAVVVAGVLPGVAVAVGLSLALALSRLARPHDSLLGDVPGLEGWVGVDEFPEATLTEGLAVFRFDAPLMFLNIERFAARVEQALADNEGDEEWLVLDFEGVGGLDATAIEGLRDLVDRLADADVTVVAVARANDRVRAGLRTARLLAPDGPLRDFPTINSAVHAFRTRDR